MGASKLFLFFAKDSLGMCKLFLGISKFFLGICKLFFGGFVEFQWVAREKKEKKVTPKVGVKNGALAVMAGLVPAIHVDVQGTSACVSTSGPGRTGAVNLWRADLAPTWMTGTSPVMTALRRSGRHLGGYEK